MIFTLNQSHLKFRVNLKESIGSILNATFCTNLCKMVDISSANLPSWVLWADLKNVFCFQVIKPSLEILTLLNVHVSTWSVSLLNGQVLLNNALQWKQFIGGILEHFNNLTFLEFVSEFVLVSLLGGKCQPIDNRLYCTAKKIFKVVRSNNRVYGMKNAWP